MQTLQSCYSVIYLNGLNKLDMKYEVIEGTKRPNISQLKIIINPCI